MAKDKEKSVNPAAAARKAEKQKAVKKGKAAIAAQRAERLAQRNPNRVQRQIDDLKALESDTGALSSRDQKQLGDLEQELSRIKKAKETVGDKYERRPQNDRRDGKDNGRGGVLGKRSRDERGSYNNGHNYRDGRRGLDKEPESSETDESVKGIPMPRDTPPPIPSRGGRGRGRGAYNANETPLGERRGPHALPDKPPTSATLEVQAQAQAVYESKPVLRDLRKEAAAFVPAAVRKNVGQGQGPTKKQEDGGGGYGDTEGTTRHIEMSGDEVGAEQMKSIDAERSVEVEEDMKRLQEEEERWRREMDHQAYVEEVEDNEA